MSTGDKTDTTRRRSQAARVENPVPESLAALGADEHHPVRKGAEGLEPDQLVAELVRDPADVTGYVVVSGFLGRSTRPDHWRLYLTDALDDFLEIPKADIVANRQVSGRTALWLRTGATVRRTRATSRRMQAEFLAGELVDEARGRISGALAEAGSQGPMFQLRATATCSETPALSPTGCFLPF